MANEMASVPASVPTEPTAVQAGAELGATVAPAALMREGDSAVPSRLDDVRACLVANHANTLALFACLRVCDVESEGLPYRDAEKQLATDPALSLSLQTPHTLLSLLVKAGGIERIDVPELADAQVDGAPADSSDAAGPAPDAPARAEEAPSASEALCATAGQPVDYLLRTTPDGRSALAEFDPVARFTDLMVCEPDGYLDAYATVLDTCGDADGASLHAIEQALAGHPALHTPKRIYPTYFVSKLETVGALAWEAGAWHTTPDGERALSSFGRMAVCDR